MTAAKGELNTLLTYKAEGTIRFARNKYYIHGDKPGKLLALQLKRDAADRCIPSIRNAQGQVTSCPKEVNSAFAEYYKTLYQKPEVVSSPESFLERLTLPELTDEQRDQIDAPIADLEIMEAIRSMKNGKSPGPDGFPCEFF